MCFAGRDVGRVGTESRHIMVGPRRPCVPIRRGRLLVMLGEISPELSYSVRRISGGAFPIWIIAVVADLHLVLETSSRQLVLGEEPRLLEFLEVGQVAQRVEPELRQESFRGDECVGRARLRAARTGGDQVQ